METQTREYACGHERKERVGRNERVALKHITVYKIDSQGEFAVWLRELKSRALWWPRGVGGVGGGKEVQKGGDMPISTADLCRNMAETNTKL